MGSETTSADKTLVSEHSPLLHVALPETTPPRSETNSKYTIRDSRSASPHWTDSMMSEPQRFSVSPTPRTSSTYRSSPTLRTTSTRSSPPLSLALLPGGFFLYFSLYLYPARREDDIEIDTVEGEGGERVRQGFLQRYWVEMLYVCVIVGLLVGLGVVLAVG
jgi:hypothetical protein